MHTYIYIEAMYRIIANWMFQCKIMQIKRCVFFALEIVFQHPAHRVDNKSSPNIVSIRLEIHTYVCAAMMMIVHDVYTQKRRKLYTTGTIYGMKAKYHVLCVCYACVCFSLFFFFHLILRHIFLFWSFAFLAITTQAHCNKTESDRTKLNWFFLYKRFSLSLYTHTVAYTAARAYIDTELETKAKR